MSLIYVNAAKSLSFFELAKVIEQHEEMFGPLRAIGPSAESTVLGFDSESDSPDLPSRLQFAGEGNPPAETEVVASGGAFILGHLIEVIAYRPLESPQRIAP
jgi:hypothetical protein